jgi:hypothetical protein
LVLRAAGRKPLSPISLSNASSAWSAWDVPVHLSSSLENHQGKAVMSRFICLLIRCRSDCTNAGDLGSVKGHLAATWMVDSLVMIPSASHAEQKSLSYPLFVLLEYVNHLLTVGLVGAVRSSECINVLDV